MREGKFLSCLALGASFLFSSVRGVDAVTTNSLSSVKGVHVASSNYSYQNTNIFSGIKIGLDANNLSTSLFLEPTGIDSSPGVVLEGSFETPMRIWQDRWKAYDSSQETNFDANFTNNLYGLYLLQPFEINKKACWKQAGGENFIWFGDLLNPRDSFDAWYIGKYPAKEVPHTRLSIPLIPSFIPNRNFENADAIFNRPWSKPAISGEPNLRLVDVNVSYEYKISDSEGFIPLTNRIERTVSSDQLNGIVLRTRYIVNGSGTSVASAGEVLEDKVALEFSQLGFKQILLVSSGVKLVWNSYDNYIYNVLRSENVDGERSVIGTNILGKYPETDFIDLSPLPRNGFYNLSGEEKILP